MFRHLNFFSDQNLRINSLHCPDCELALSSQTYENRAVCCDMTLS
ncbi:hypothetical protein M153_8350001122 [Pseudoloma neurophilia]|uniref:Uncharacterized protein n=1 Tax=Pseudoloma neurophilia TaxID=146866 RepID=A0A0R0M233_9MICR|nr:hypothetical protein M153_8350001122 [Pseudoloma neurophilia]